MNKLPSATKDNYGVYWTELSGGTTVSITVSPYRLHIGWTAMHLSVYGSLSGEEAEQLISNLTEALREFKEKKHG